MVYINKKVWLPAAACFVWSCFTSVLLAVPQGQKSRAQHISPYRSGNMVLRSTTRSSRRRNRQIIVDNPELGDTQGILFEQGDYTLYERNQLNELERIHTLQKRLFRGRHKLNIREIRRLELDIKSARNKLKSLRYIRGFPYGDCMDTMVKAVQDLRRKNPGQKYSHMTEEQILLQIQKEQKKILTDYMARRNLRRKAKRRF